jgi:hypothetical protein
MLCVVWMNCMLHCEGIFFKLVDDILQEASVMASGNKASIVSRVSSRVLLIGCFSWEVHSTINFQEIFSKQNFNLEILLEKLFLISINRKERFLLIKTMIFRKNFKSIIHQITLWNIQTIENAPKFFPFRIFFLVKNKYLIFKENSKRKTKIIWKKKR